MNRSSGRQDNREANIDVSMWVLLIIEYERARISQLDDPKELDEMGVSGPDLHTYVRVHSDISKFLVGSAQTSEVCKKKGKHAS